MARDTVFAAVMITMNGILGLSLLIGARRFHLVHFNAEGSGGALATVTALATLSLVVPTFTTSQPGPQFSGPQLVFAACASLFLYGAFVLTQTVRHRDFFLPVTASGDLAEEDHATPPTAKATWTSLGLPMVGLVAVVGLAVNSPTWAWFSPSVSPRVGPFQRDRPSPKTTRSRSGCPAFPARTRSRRGCLPMSTQRFSCPRGDRHHARAGPYTADLIERGRGRRIGWLKVKLRHHDRHA